MDIVSDLKNPFGIVNNKLVHIKDIEKGTEVYCPICKDRLIVRQGEQMVKHLSHKNNTGIGCSGESVIHKLIKEYLYQELKSLKIQEHKIDVIEGKFKLSEDEELDIKDKYLEYRDLSPQYIPDVFVILEGNYRIGLEICYKNPKDVSHLQELLPNLPIDIVLEIQVNEDDLSDLNLNELMNRATVIYNRLSGGFTKAHDKIVEIVNKYNTVVGFNDMNKLEQYEKLKKLYEDKSKYKNKLEVIKTELKNSNTIIENKTKEIQRLRNNNHYYKEFSKCRKAIRELYKTVLPEYIGYKVNATADECVEAISIIVNTWNTANDKIKLLKDGIDYIHEQLNLNLNLGLDSITDSRNFYRFSKYVEGIELFKKALKDSEHVKILNELIDENRMLKNYSDKYLEAKLKTIDLQREIDEYKS